MEIREELLKKSWNALYQLRNDQYCTKEEIVDDILEHDDGSVRERLETEGSFLWLMTKAGMKKAMGGER